ncbi:MAG: Phosphoenolpyruvate-protein phosphotransferase of PTS system [uncultured Rubrobacteraceae bacterium]|uniref:Phosphoenolpyruvate-protein phosphotransferase n=1 Tax=uncultured Rubrobacteraceae bacterium TaxID=349277 RepID=A0A6J4QMJ5_9ACTN|nr:MAG: Phosphoenolpyruvate-protein phosphotransferase of PTS system [uncultured Rubrobacteraceae bacterium]
MMAGTRLTGVAASEGVAVGPAFVHVSRELEPEREKISEGEVEEELGRFQGAVKAVAKELSATVEELRAGGSEKEAGIFEAHVEMAEDPEFQSEVEERVKNLESPEAAVISVGEEFAGMFAAMEDEYMAARADDVRDVASQIAVELMGGGVAGLEALSEPSVILALNLAPSDTARIPKGMALGFVIAEGSRTSHVSIMARSFGIPAVVGVGAELEDVLGASTVALDGTEGYAVADPDEDVISDFEQKQKDAAAEAALLEEYIHTEARTKDGRRIEIAANIGSAEEAEGAIEWGAEGVGLFRTEFLFMKRTDLPSEEEQYEAYREVAEEFGERPVIIRTIDVGGDKDLPGVDQPEEENPFLGWRGIRMCLDVPELFKPQLRAILRAASYGRLRIMFPMVVDTVELRAAKEILEECREELKSEGTEYGEVEVGVMVETPAAAIRAGDIAPEVAFFSVGTNDLVQYTLAADRGNERLTRLQSADHPAVLDLIGKTCEAAREAGIWVGVCGESAGEPDMIPKLVELGVAELSMSAPSIPRAKKIVSEL